MRHLVLLTLLLPLVAHAGVLDETRYCGTPARDAGGKIIRHSEVVAAFRKVHPCPSTHKTTGACPGWAVDHVVSLGAKHPILGGGCDAVSNMQWLPLEIKSCAGVICKDRWELSVYSLQGATP